MLKTKKLFKKSVKTKKQSILCTLPTTTPSKQPLPKETETMSTSSHINEQDLCPPRVERKEKKEEEIQKLPAVTTSNSTTIDDDEPGPLIKGKLISLLLVLFSVFLDYMGISICQPILPYYAELFSASSTQLGALYSSYSGMSLLASLFSIVDDAAEAKWSTKSPYVNKWYLLRVLWRFS